MSASLTTKLPVVGVMGSGSHAGGERAIELGRWLARKRVHLLTGGGGGSMASVSKAFFETSDRVGMVLGVLPSDPDDPLCRPKAGYPNPWVEVAVHTHLPLSGDQGTDVRSRNHINILSADAVIALAGGPGTVSELSLAVQYQRPAIAFIESANQLRGMPASLRIAQTINEVEAFLSSHIDLKTVF